MNLLFGISWFFPYRGTQENVRSAAVRCVDTQFTEEEKRLFNMLKKAYIDARYKKSYSINKKK
jgi:hypothetical protein